MSPSAIAQAYECGATPTVRGTAALSTADLWATAGPISVTIG
jgi:hypothetical protein